MWVKDGVARDRVGALGITSNKHTCLDCGLTIIDDSYNSPFREYGRVVRCPICSSMDKKPSEKLSPEESTKLKKEIKGRLHNE